MGPKLDCNLSLRYRDVARSGIGWYLLTGTTHAIIKEPPFILSFYFGATFKIFKSSTFDAHVQMLKYALSTTVHNIMACTIIGPYDFSDVFGAEAEILVAYWVR